jgi:hypothetical protein
MNGIAQWLMGRNGEASCDEATLGKQRATLITTTLGKSDARRRRAVRMAGTM